MSMLKILARCLIYEQNRRTGGLLDESSNGRRGMADCQCEFRVL